MSASNKKPVINPIKHKKGSPVANAKAAMLREVAKSVCRHARNEQLLIINMNPTETGLVWAKSKAVVGSYPRASHVLGNVVDADTDEHVAVVCPAPKYNRLWLFKPDGSKVDISLTEPDQRKTFSSTDGKQSFTFTRSLVSHRHSLLVTTT